MNPCTNCPRKGCGAYHDICPAHQEMKKEREKINHLRFLENDAMAISTNREKRYRKKVRGKT